MNNFECIYDCDSSKCSSDSCEECFYYSCRYCICVSAVQCKSCKDDSDINFGVLNFRQKGDYLNEVF